MKTKLITICVLFLLASTITIDAATIFGIKSLAVSPSGAPTELYDFQVDSNGNVSDFTDRGRVRLSGSDIDVDGLAHSNNLGLLAFQLSGGQSRLISINSSDAQASVIGGFLSREIRGAVFQNGVLLALDAANEELVKINPATGAVEEVLALTLNGSSFGISNTSDLAYNGQLYVGSNSSAYTVDLQDGSLTLQGSLVSSGGTGLAFGTERHLFSYEVGGADDIFRHDINNGFNQSLAFGNIISGFNSGRGDLAQATEFGTLQFGSPVVPEPAAWVMLLGGIGLLWWRTR